MTNASMAWAHHRAGAALLGLGEIDKAQDELNEALAIAKPHNIQSVEATTLAFVGE